MSETTNRTFDFDDVNPEAQEAQKDSYPYFQWHHGKSDLEDLGKNDVRFTGGFIYPLKQKASRFGDDFTLPGFAPVTIKLGQNKQECLGAKSAKFAILRRRFCWMRKDERGREVYYSAKVHPYEKGMVGKMQLLAVPQGIPADQSADYLFVLTAKATAQVNMRKAIDDHANFIVAAANKSAPAGKKLPHYAFYTHIGAGSHEMKGEGSEASEVTQPRLYAPQNIDRDYLFDLYIGKERLIVFQELYLSLEEWARAWDTDAGVKGEFADNPQDVWAATDEQVSEFVKLCAMLKDFGEPMEKLNAIAQGVAGVSNIKLASPAAMDKVLAEFEKQHKWYVHQARMALQSPTGHNQPAGDDAAYYGEPTDNDISF